MERRGALPVIKSIALAFFAVGLAASLILFPTPVLTASLKGLDLWWEVVFPSLLPFFITAELLIGFGVVHGLGAVSERIMRPLFNVPGCGGFVWVMGMASGYPAGARWTTDLYKNGQVTRTEAERLVAFTNASSPLFIFGAVAVGFFHDAGLGILIASAHYGGNFIIGILMRFYKRKDLTRKRDHTSSSLKEAFWTMHHSRLRDGRTLGKLLGDAVTKSVDTLLMVGGFIMLFSVLTELLKQTGLIHLFTHFLALTPLPEGFHIPLTAGMLELTTGIGAVTQSHEALPAQLVAVSFILGFHGFSIQAQIASILAETDIRFLPYALARCAHAVIAACLTYLLYFLYQPFQASTIPSWNPARSDPFSILAFFQQYGPPLTLSAILLMIFIRWRAQAVKNY